MTAPAAQGPRPVQAGPEGRAAELLGLLEAAAADLPVEELPVVIGRLEVLKASLLQRTLARPMEESSQSDDDSFVSIEEVCRALKRSKSWVYDTWPSLPFASQRVAGGRIWYSRARLKEYIRTSGGRFSDQKA